MISAFVREQKRYAQSELAEMFQCPDGEILRILKRLKEYGILKAVKASDAQKDLSDLLEEDIELVSIGDGDSELLYVFTFVGVVIVEDLVLKCFPKYILSEKEPTKALKQVLHVLEKFNAKEQIIRTYNETSDSSAFNMLAVVLFLLRDYFENGLYTNTREIIETNGTGEILWDKTINETFTLLSNNRPYYPELLTRKRVNDDFDYFKRLHECVLTKCSGELEKAGLLDLFGLTEVLLSEEELEDFGEKEYILDRIEKELNTQYNTHKQMILKTIYAFLAHRGTREETGYLSTFGTSNFKLVWEDVCKEVLDDQLYKPLAALPIPLAPKYQSLGNIPLIGLIEKPKWQGKNADGGTFDKYAAKTLVPDLVSIVNNGRDSAFIIFDAKYYNLQLEEGKPLSGQPGIESITKQYMYQQAYRDFVEEHHFAKVRNCFLLPTEESHIIDKGSASLEMMQNLGFEDIQLRMLPAQMVFSHYLDNSKMNIQQLKL